MRVCVESQERLDALEIAYDTREWKLGPRALVFGRAHTAAARIRNIFMYMGSWSFLANPGRPASAASALFLDLSFAGAGNRAGGDEATMQCDDAGNWMRVGRVAQSLSGW